MRLWVLTGQIYSISYENDAIDFISDKIKTKENKGKLTMQVLRLMKMVNLTLAFVKV